MVIVLDPGHGGSDPGAIGPGGTREKDVNLKIALAASAWLQKQGVQVVLTRVDDYDVSLQNRCDIANQAGAACFVSIHCNAATDPDAQGAETYYHDDSEEGRKLAQCLQENVTALGLPGRGAKSDFNLHQSGLYVLRNTVMPAALVEVAFISNPDEEAWLNDPANQDAAGKAIAKGVCAYLGIPFAEISPAPEEFPRGDSPAGGPGGSGGDGAGSAWDKERQVALSKLAAKARFNSPHTISEPVTMGMLAVVLERMGLI